MTTERRTVIVDDDPAIRAIVRALLDDDEEYSVVGEASDGEAGLSLIRRECPDLVLLDLAMPVMDGLEVLVELRAEMSASEVIVLSGFPSESAAAVSARALGAAGFVEKDSLVEFLLSRLHLILDTAQRSRPTTAGTRVNS